MFTDNGLASLKHNVMLYIIVVLFISVGIYNSHGYTDEVDEQVRVCGDDRVVILTASNGAKGFGHTTLLIEEDDVWFYFSWQSTKVVFSEVPPHAMVDLDSFNSWIREDESLQSYIADYDSAMLIHGEFSRSVIKAESYFVDYLQEQDLNMSDLDSFNMSFLKRNLNYRLLSNNCVEFAYNVLSEGVVGCEPFSEVMERPSLISNVAKLQFEAQLDFEEFLWD